MISISIIDITEKCNLNCIYCCRKGDLKTIAECDYKYLLDVIRQINEIRGTFVVLQGGEPLMNSNAIKIIKGMGKLKEVRQGYFLENLTKLIHKRYPSKKFTKYYMKLLIDQVLPLYCLTTNGMIYSNALEQALYESGFSLEVSLDSPTPEINNAGRIGSDFERISSNIQTYAKRLPVEISCTITENNVHDIKNMLDFAAQKGCICVKYSPVIMIGKRKEDSTRWENIYLDSLREIVRLFNNHEYNLYLKVKLNPHILMTQKGIELTRELESTPNVIVERHECAAFKKIKDIYIDTKLNVFGCASMKNSTDLVIGNLYQDSLKDIWNSDRRKQLACKVQSYCNKKQIYGSCTAVAYSKQNGGT